MTIEIFRRKEQKYLITIDQYAELVYQLLPYMRPDKFGENGKYKVTSLYFESPDNKIYFETKNNLKYRQKLRLRIYDNTDAKDIAYIFFGLCVGMTCGLYQFDLAIILTVFASILFYLLYKFEYGKGKDTQILKVTVPENLNHENLLDDIFETYTISNSLRQVETTNLGTMILYTYAVQCKNNTNLKELLDRIREKNANLKVSISYM